MENNFKQAIYSIEYIYRISSKIRLNQEIIDKPFRDAYNISVTEK